MNKLATVLAIIIIVLSSVCGVLLYQIIDLQNHNNNLQNQISQLENEIGEFENQLSDLEDQNLELRNQTRALEEKLEFLTNGSLLVRITEFVVEGFGPLGALTIESYANVTVQNFGAKDMRGMILTVKHTSIEQEASNLAVGLLRSGEVKTFRTRVIWNLSVSGTFVATLKLDHVVLDERTISSFK